MNKVVFKLSFEEAKAFVRAISGSLKAYQGDHTIGLLLREMTQTILVKYLMKMALVFEGRRRFTLSTTEAIGMRILLTGYTYADPYEMAVMTPIYELLDKCVINYKK